MPLEELAKQSDESADQKAKAGMAASKPEQPAGYRKPTTNDPADFWFVSHEKWQGLLDDSDSPNRAVRKVAVNNLRKFDQAGRVMETSDGQFAAVACKACTKRGCDCKVFADNPQVAQCAFCKRHGRQGCDAQKQAVIRSESESESEKAEEAQAVKPAVASLSICHTCHGSKARVATLEETIARLEGDLVQMKTQIDKLSTWFLNFSLKDSQATGIGKWGPSVESKLNSTSA